MVLVKSVMGCTALAAALVFGFTACQPKVDEAALQAQAASLAQAKAADERVAMLEQQVSAMKAGKQVATGDQAAINQIAAAHLRALDRQLADAKGRATERRRDAQGSLSNPAQHRGRFEMVEVPSGARITVKLNAELATDKDQPGDPWNGTTVEDVRVGDTVAWPAGTAVSERSARRSNAASMMAASDCVSIGQASTAERDNAPGSLDALVQFRDKGDTDKAAARVESVGLPP